MAILEQPWSERHPAGVGETVASLSAPVPPSALAPWSLPASVPASASVSRVGSASRQRDTNWARTPRFDMNGKSWEHGVRRDELRLAALMPNHLDTLIPDGAQVAVAASAHHTPPPPPSPSPIAPPPLEPPPPLQSTPPPSLTSRPLHATPRPESVAEPHPNPTPPPRSHDHKQCPLP